MKATVEMCQMLKAENTKLKQDKEELIEKLKQEIEDNADYYDEEDTGTIAIPTLLKILERLG